MYTPKRQQLRVENATLTAGVTAAVRLDQIQPIASIAGGHTYLRSLLIEVSATLVGNASDVIGEDHLHDLFSTIMLRLPGLDRPMIEFSTFAGSRLRYTQHFLSGKRSRAANGGAGGNVTPAAAGGTTYRLKYEIRFYLDRGVRESDLGMPIAFLREAADLELTVANTAAGGVFGAVIAAGAVTLTACTAELYERPEFVLPAFFAWQLFRLNQIQGNLPVAGRVLIGMIEVAAQTNAVGQAVIATGDRLTVQVSCDGRMVCERVRSQSLITQWCNYVAKARAEELADEEAGTNSWAPIFFPQAGDNAVKLTQAPLCVGRPEYLFTGADTSPDLLVLTTDLNDRQASLNRVARAGVATPDDWDTMPDKYLTAKTASKQPTAKGPDSGARVPLRLHLTVPGKRPAAKG